MKVSRCLRPANEHNDLLVNLNGKEPSIMSYTCAFITKTSQNVRSKRGYWVDITFVIIHPASQFNGKQ